MAKKNPFFSKFGTRLESFDPGSIQSYIHLLSREHGMLENLFNAIREGIVVISENGRILYHNAVAKEIFGIPDDFSRVSINSFVKGVDWENIFASADSSDHTVRTEVEIFYPVRRVLSFYALHRSHAPGRMPGKELTETEKCVTLIFNDITNTYDRLHNAAETERTALISLLAAEVAHEIGNPLNSIYLHLQLFQRLLDSGNFDVEEASEMTAAARGEVERLDHIIHNFLGALRPSKGVFQLLDVKDCVLETLNFMRIELEGRRIKVNCSWSDTLPMIRGDREQLKQSFYNLIKNAVQAMTGGGELRISCSNDDRSVLIAFSDSGSGIKSENASRIFSPRFTTKEKGSGIGLMVVERIVREHGGHISFASTVGEGTKFIIAFPRADVQCRVLPTSEKSGKRKSLPAGSIAIQEKE
ncbi:MAG: GHKL domain-containing protein [Lentisphaeria bacterium]|nr:GHKL domain-containing protein [Lentisphaeria bacterium]